MAIFLPRKVQESNLQRYSQVLGVSNQHERLKGKPNWPVSQLGTPKRQTQGEQVEGSGFGPRCTKKLAGWPPAPGLSEGRRVRRLGLKRGLAWQGFLMVVGCTL